MLLSAQQVYNSIFNNSNWLISNYSKFANINQDDLVSVGMSVAKTESRSFNTDAQNNTSSAKGLMQIVDGTKKFIETKILSIPEAPLNQMFDYNYNIKLGLAYLAYQYMRYGDWRKSVIAYNQGSYNESEAGKNYYATSQKMYDSFDFAMLNNMAKKGNVSYAGFSLNNLSVLKLAILGGFIGIGTLMVYIKFIK